jgi:monofunctional biosynthetic peptidoglycan transglycosylase
MPDRSPTPPDARPGLQIERLGGRSSRVPLPERAPVRAPERERPRRRFSLLRLLLQLVFIVVALVLLAVVGLRWLPPPVTSYMLQSPVHPVLYTWVPASRIADVARRAVVASEDQKFWTHHGFDLEAIEQAQQHNRVSRHRRGASTISQQTAKNLFLWPGGYVRKGLEAALTVLIEKLWGKNRILEMYLNIAEFGPGVYGIEAASKTYFGKSAAQLSPEEAARLAAVLPNPRHWSVTAPGPYVQKRAAWILGQMGYGTRNTPQEEPEPPPAEQDDPALPAAPAAEASSPPGPLQAPPPTEFAPPSERAPVDVDALPAAPAEAPPAAPSDQPPAAAPQPASPPAPPPAPQQ